MVIFHPIKFKSFPNPIAVSSSWTIDCGWGPNFSPDTSARGYIAKSDTARDLVIAIEALRRNKTFFTPKVDQLVLDSFLRSESTKKTLQSPLTSRQREIVQLLTEGKSSKEVATLLNLSIKTIETHRANIMKRLHCHSFSDLVFYALRNNIIHL